MTPRNVNDIVNARLAEMTPEERDAYDTELAEARRELMHDDAPHRPTKDRRRRWIPAGLMRP